MWLLKYCVREIGEREFSTGFTFVVLIALFLAMAALTQIINPHA